MIVSPSLLYGFSAGLIAVSAEIGYRSIPGPWSSYLWAWIPMQTAMSYCIYRLVTIPDTTLIAAFVTFAFCTITLRVLASLFIFADKITLGTWIALGLIILAKFIQSYLGK